ncbi:hypothetical protein LB518_06740 [Mesorhizobium sp. BR1-1-16]|uniref:transaldolase family protein n=1 Tax=Mesorhizobium sp. BR1-1-16 TaxID=2876653 RepID=UPI001CCB599A|nr:transaldolase family protein [Mesorhizobium sp. BR1-1-16]MBZ9935983.1 hypothetical protein [Mesorhizobium sp. BR1-1-16]
MADDNRGRLRLFLDTAEKSAWREWLPTGIFYGVTTNPSLLAAASIPCNLAVFPALVDAAFSLGANEMQIQTFGRTADALERNGRAIAALDPRIVVKVPVTFDGAVAAMRLKADGIRVTVTAVYAAHQALTATALGADYVAPYFGRMNDADRDGEGEIVAMRDLVAKSGSATRILVASLRSADDLARLAARGLDTFTISPKVAGLLFADPLTQAAAEAFEAAAEAD